MQQVSDQELKVILEYAKKALMFEGDFVELGCYKGATSLELAKLLQRHNSNSTPVKNQASAVPSSGHFNSSFSSSTSLAQASAVPSSKSPKTLYLYDSFAGLPEKSPEDSSAAGDQFKAGELDCTKSDLIKLFKKHNLPLPRIKKAFFEDLTPADLPEKIAFAFLDGDLYTSIKTSLALIEPRITKDTIILVHDYNNPALPGVARALDAWTTNITIRETIAIVSEKK